MRRTLLALVALLGLLALPAHARDTVYYYYTDALHSAVVETDAQGAVLERTRYTPYGQVLNRLMRNGPGYTGHQEDPATGLVYMQQRYYDPESGRFLSTDPVQASGGSFNRYAYANGNPYRYVDPSGMASQKAEQRIKKEVQPCTGSYTHCPSGTRITQVGSPSVSGLATAAAHQQPTGSRTSATQPSGVGSDQPTTTISVDSLFTGDTKPTFTGVAAYGLGVVAHKTPGPGNDEVAFTPAGLGLEATATWHLLNVSIDFGNAKHSPAYISVLSGRAGLGLVGGHRN